MTVGFGKVMVIVFVIAHDIDHMSKLLTAALHKVVIPIATVFCSHDVVGIMLCDIPSHKDITTENQHISVAAVVKLQVTKFKV
jgi:hypothetical protein